jgi:hypothetical protein
MPNDFSLCRRYPALFSDPFDPEFLGPMETNADVSCIALEATIIDGSITGRVAVTPDPSLRHPVRAAAAMMHPAI